MGIRKTGSATGSVTGVESPGGTARLTATASRWGDGDDQALADENAAADEQDD